MRKSRRVAPRLWRFWLAGPGMSRETGVAFALAAATGAAVGLAAAGFEFLIELFRDVLMNGTGGFRPLLDSGGICEYLSRPGFWSDPSRWMLLVLPAAGAAAAALLIKWFSPFTHARGTDSAVYVYHHLKGRFSAKVIPTKAVASALVVGSGGSAGYEGPVTLIGAACGSTISRFLRPRDPSMRRLMMAVGMAAGIGALFRAPLAGAIFGAEILYSGPDMEYEVLLPSFTASAIAYTVFALFFGWDPVFALPQAQFANGLMLLPCIVLAAVVAVGAKFYILVFRTFEHLFGRMAMPAWKKVAVGGLMTGAIGFFFPDALGNGYHIVREAFATASSGAAQGGLDACGLGTAGLFLALFFLKTFATSFTVGSGGSGGVFGPALVCGASLGMATGVFFTRFFPGCSAVPPASFALAGMAGFVAAAVRTPVAAVIMVAELSGNHVLLLPTMWVCGIAFWLTGGWSLYRSQVRSRTASPVHAAG